MVEGKFLESKFMIWGVVISVLTFSFYYFLIEKTVHENRLTYSVSEEDFKNYASLSDYFVSESSMRLSVSPNYSSIADSLIEKGIRRFELKQFYTGTLQSPEQPEVLYFNDQNLAAPQLLLNRYVSSNKPLNKSLGVSILLLCVFLLFDRFTAVNRARS